MSDIIWLQACGLSCLFHSPTKEEAGNGGHHSLPPFPNPSVPTPLDSPLVSLFGGETVGVTERKMMEEVDGKSETIYKYII